MAGPGKGMLSSTMKLQSIPWERSFLRRHVLLALKGLVLSVVRARPREGGFEYYRAVALALIGSIVRREPINPCLYLRKDVWVTFGGFEYVLTRETVFGYFLHTFEPATAGLLGLTHGNVFVDLGANVGQYTVPLSRNFREVVAVEPNPIAVRLLERNLERNGIQNVRIVPKAVTLSGGEVQLTEGAYLTTWGIHSRGARTITVPAITLDELLTGFPLVDLLKIDIEGLEVPIVLASKEIRRAQEISLACVADDVPALTAALEARGFTLKVPPTSRGLEENAHAILRSAVNAGRAP